MKRLNYLCLVGLLSISSAAQAVTIDMVTVGNPGNAPDTRYNGISVGSLANVYQIGKYEVTAGQYTEFLNAVAKAEPSTLLLLCFGSLALLWRRRRLVCASILAAAVGISFADRAAADTFGSGANTFDIEFVTIGNPGNAADTTGAPNPAGSVPYTYRMAKFETSERMINYANAEGGLGVTQDIRTVDKATTGMSWNEAARFVNWLNTSTGSTPAYKFAVQPGEAGYIANTRIELWTPSDAGYDPNNLYRNSLARYFLPSVHEWYKAAYYDPTSGVYYDYPTGSDTEPTPVASGTEPGTAVYVTLDGGALITQTGGLSPYGTMGQGGNAYELEETDFDLVNGPTDSFSPRAYRGGFWSQPSFHMLSSVRFSTNPIRKANEIGFRVASNAIPEPSTLLLAIAAFAHLLAVRRKTVAGRPVMKTSIAALAILSSAITSPVLADTFGSGANTFDIPFVTIGNPGNVPDDISANPDFAGSVPYTYRMGKFEISEQMIAKANADGGLGITKVTRSPDKPAQAVSWNEAARFVNWLNTSTGSTPAYKFAVQPGGGGYNANANIQLWLPTDAGYDPNNLYRNSLARYFLPSVHEWYKAAYYDPIGGVYYDYPTGSNSVPDGIDFAGDPNFDAVFDEGAHNPEPNDITNVGVLSPYGTAGQGGNVYEWEETDFDLVNGPTVSTLSRGLRGGAWYDGVPSGVLASFRSSSNPTGDEFQGLRVASSAIPEPSTLLLLCLGSLAVFWRRRGIVYFAILAVAVHFSFAHGAAAVTTVPVGDAGNPADQSYAGQGQFGAVPYGYRIAIHEVTNSEYALFLNLKVSIYYDPFNFASLTFNDSKALLNERLAARVCLVRVSALLFALKPSVSLDCGRARFADVRLPCTQFDPARWMHVLQARMKYERIVMKTISCSSSFSAVLTVTAVVALLGTAGLQRPVCAWESTAFSPYRRRKKVGHHV